MNVSKPSKSACYLNLLNGQIVHTPRRDRELESADYLKFMGTYHYDKVKIKPNEKGWAIFLNGKLSYMLTLGQQGLVAREKYFAGLIKNVEDAKKEEGNGNTEAAIAG